MCVGIIDNVARQHSFPLHLAPVPKRLLPTGPNLNFSKDNLLCISGKQPPHLANDWSTMKLTNVSSTPQSVWYLLLNMTVMFSMSTP